MSAHTLFTKAVFYERYKDPPVIGNNSMPYMAAMSWVQKVAAS